MEEFKSACSLMTANNKRIISVIAYLNFGKSRRNLGRT